MKKHTHSRRGVSLTEVVVALMAIAIISAATMSVVMMSVNQEAKSVRAFEVRNSAENAVECFRFAMGEAEGFQPENFIEYMEMTTAGKRFAEQDGSYVLDAGNFLVTITLLADQETVYGFSYLAVDGDGGEVFSYTFKNGGVQ